MPRVLLVVSVRDYDYIIESLRSMGLEVDAIYVPDVLFRDPDRLLSELPSGWSERYDYVIVPGSYPWDLSKLGGRVVKGTEGLGLLPEALLAVGLQGLSASLSFEKAHPQLMAELAAKALAELRKGPLLPVRPPPVRVLAEVTINDDDSLDLIIARAVGVVSDGADAVILAPVGGDRSERRALTALGEVRRRAGVAVGLDANKALLREAAARGADILLSLRASEAVREDLSWAKGKSVVLLVNDDYELSAADEAARRLWAMGVTPVLDPVALPPLSPGLTGFIRRLLGLSSVNSPKMVGLSNVIELMDADTSGSSALLTALAAELGVGSFLVEEASTKARGLVAEARAAADMVSLSLLWRKPPKDLGVSLLEAKLKVGHVNVSEGVSLRLLGRDVVEVVAGESRLRVDCRSYDPGIIEALEVSESVKLRLAVAVYRACLPWSSVTGAGH